MAPIVARAPRRRGLCNIKFDNLAQSCTMSPCPPASNNPQDLPARLRRARPRRVLRGAPGPRQPGAGPGRRPRTSSCASGAARSRFDARRGELGSLSAPDGALARARPVAGGPGRRARVGPLEGRRRRDEARVEDRRRPRPSATRRAASVREALRRAPDRPARGARARLLGRHDRRRDRAALATCRSARRRAASGWASRKLRDGVRRARSTRQTAPKRRLCPPRDSVEPLQSAGPLALEGRVRPPNRGARACCRAGEPIAGAEERPRPGRIRGCCRGSDARRQFQRRSARRAARPRARQLTS